MFVEGSGFGRAMVTMTGDASCFRARLNAQSVTRPSHKGLAIQKQWSLVVQYRVATSIASCQRPHAAPRFIVRRLARVIFVLLPCIGFGPTIGCLGPDPNDPNINPKARHQIMTTAAVARLASCAEQAYERSVTRRINPQNGILETVWTYGLRQPCVMPTRIVVSYDSVSRIAQVD